MVCLCLISGYLEHHLGARRHASAVTADVKVFCLQMSSAAVEPLAQALFHVKDDVRPRPGHGAQKSGAAVTDAGAQRAAITLTQGGALPHHHHVESVNEGGKNIGCIGARLWNHHAAGRVDSGVDGGGQPQIGLRDQRRPGALAGQRSCNVKE